MRYERQSNQIVILEELGQPLLIPLYPTFGTDTPHQKSKDLVKLFFGFDRITLLLKEFGVEGVIRRNIALIPNEVTEKEPLHIPRFLKSVS